MSCKYWPLSIVPVFSDINLFITLFRLFSVILNFVAQVEVISNVDYQRKPSHKIRARREIDGSPSAASNQRQYVGENIIKRIGDKWKIWFHKNNATTDEPPLNETRTLLRRRRRKLAKHNLSGIVHVKNNSSVTLSQNDSLPSVHKDAEYWRKLMDCFKSVKTNSDVSTEKSIKIRYKSVQPTKAENHDTTLKNTMLTGNVNFLLISTKIEMNP